MLTDQEAVAAIARLGRVTIRWWSPRGCRVGIRASIAQLDRLFRAGAIDRETYATADGTETIYFIQQPTAPIPDYAVSYAAYPIRAVQ